MPYFIYILECVNGTYYTGYTTDITRRIQEHFSRSSKCKYTRSFPPKRVAACWEISEDVSLALKLERTIKKLTKSEKTDLIESPELLANALHEKDCNKLAVISL